MIYFVAAIVNDDVITSDDLLSRIQLTMTLSGLPDQPDVRQRIAPQLLQKLIDESLQRQAAESSRFSVTKDDITRALDQLATRQGKTVEELHAFLNANNIPVSTVERQIESEMLWNLYMLKKNPTSREGI